MSGSRAIETDGVATEAEAETGVEVELAEAAVAETVPRAVVAPLGAVQTDRPRGVGVGAGRTAEDAGVVPE